MNRDNPSWDQFNHAIVALPREDGGYDLLDPTIELAAAGDQSQSQTERDILIVKPDRGAWYRVSNIEEQQIETYGDLKLSSDGSLSGWFTLSATGISAAQYASYYNAWDDANRRQIFAEFVDGFIPGAEVIDIDYTPLEHAVSNFPPARLHCPSLGPRRRRQFGQLALSVL